MVRPVRTLAALATCVVLAPLFGFAAHAETDAEVRCESFDGRRKSCGSGSSGEVYLIRQLNDTTCAKGVSWGVANGRIWVDRGCRGLFRIRRNDARPTLNLSDVTLHAKACVGNKIHPDAWGGDKGLEYCTSAIRSGLWSGKDMAALHYARGVRYFRQRRYATAIPDFDQAIRLNPVFAQAYTGRCGANAATGKLDRAIADCDRALQLNPNDPQTRALRAKLNR